MESSVYLQLVALYLTLVLVMLLEQCAPLHCLGLISGQAQILFRQVFLVLPFSASGLYTSAEWLQHLGTVFIQVLIEVFMLAAGVAFQNLKPDNG